MLFILTWILCFGAVAGGQPPAANWPTPEAETKLELAKSLHTWSMHDSAHVILDSLYGILVERGTTDSAFGLEVRLQLAYAWERKEDYPRAAREVHQIIDQSRHCRQPATEAGSLLLMALIHEEQARPADCVFYLNLATEVIRKHRIREIEAKLAIRKASYERLFGSVDRADYFARQSLKHALDQHQPYAQAEAHLLLSILSIDKAPEESEAHLLKAAAIYRRHEAYFHNTIVALNLSSLRTRQGDLDAAMRYSDTALCLLAQPIFRNGLLTGYRTLAWEKRGDLFYRLGQLDSAYHYLSLAKAAEGLEFKRRTAERVSQIEASYQNDQREQQLLEQERALDYRRQKESWLLWFILLAVVSLVVVGINLLRLRRANASISEQSGVIHEKNVALATALEEQQLLRGELHHRVKNNLQIIIGLLDMQIEESSDSEVANALESTVGRIYSIAAIHDILDREDRVGVINFQRYVGKLTEHCRGMLHDGQACSLDLDIPPVDFTLETAVPLGTIINELLTNSLKYADLPDRDLKIHIGLKEVAGGYLLSYCDNGPGYPPELPGVPRRGLGTHLVRGMARQLSGRLVTYNDGGACSEVHFRRRTTTRQVSSGVPRSAEPVQS